MITMQIKEELLQELVCFCFKKTRSQIIYNYNNLPSVQVFPVKPASGQRQEYFPALSTDKHDCFSGQGTPQRFCQKNDKFQRNVMSSQFFTTKLNNVQLWLKAIF